LSSVKINFWVFDINLAEQGIFEFPYVWHLSTYVISWFKFFPLFVIVSMISTEYSNKTIKQNLIDGMSKKEFVLSKFLVAGLLAAFTTLFVFVLGLILGLIYSTNTSPEVIFTDLSYLLALFVKLYCFFSFGLFLGVLIKRSAFAIGALLIWYIFEKIMIHGIIGAFVSYETQSTIGGYFPLQAMENMVPEPITRMAGVQQMSEMGGAFYAPEVYWVQMPSLIIAAVWSLIFMYLSYALIKKRDL
jgi:ABC-type transport system involved in multi-copper enzyme maturation permease subunit